MSEKEKFILQRLNIDRLKDDPITGEINHGENEILKDNLPDRWFFKGVECFKPENTDEIKPEIYDYAKVSINHVSFCRWSQVPFVDDLM